MANLAQTVKTEAARYGLTSKQADVFIGEGFVNLPLSVARGRFGEMLLLNLYRWFREDGTFDLGFHEMPEATWETFCSYFTQPPNYRNVLIPCLVQNDEVTYPMGMMWIDGFKIDPGITRGNVSLWFLKRHWESRIPLRAARKGISYCHEILNVDVVYGITPAENERSCAFARMVGMAECGRIPLWTYFHGKPADAKVFFKAR